MELTVEAVELVVCSLVVGDGGVGDFLEACHRHAGGIKVGVGSRNHGSGNSGAQSATLRGAGDSHFTTRDVGVNLHQEGVLFGNAAGADNAINGDVVFLEAFDDGAGSEGGGFNQSAIDFGWSRVEGLS